MQHFQLKYSWIAAVASTTIVSSLIAGTTTTEIRNKHRSMASGETTVFAQGESDKGGNQSYRGGLGVNFPSGSSVRLLVAQRPAFERIEPGEKLTTTAATTSSGGYNTAAATSNSTANSISFSSSSCSLSYATPTYSINFSGVVDSQNKEIYNYPTGYTAEKRSNPGTLGSGGWVTAAEGDIVSCLGGSGSLPYSCYIQVRATGPDAKVISLAGKQCTCTAVGSCTITDI